MARYELGAIYEINSDTAKYYARLLGGDTYGVFEPVSGEITAEKFASTPYRLYITTGSFAVKREYWKKILSPSKDTSPQQWDRPLYLVYYYSWDISESLDKRLASMGNIGASTSLNYDDYVRLLKQGLISLIFPMYENIPNFLDQAYNDWPHYEILYGTLTGTPKHQEEQLLGLKKLGYDIKTLPNYAYGKS